MVDKLAGMETMLSFEEAGEKILAGMVAVTETEVVDLEHLPGRVLAGDVTAGMNVPNHDNSAMDGYAVRSVDLAGTGEVRLRVVSDLAAGGYHSSILNQGEAVRIMTGAPIPPGADAVVIQEICRRNQDWVTVPCGCKPGEHVRSAGEDMKVGDKIFATGRRLRPADVGVLAAQGISQGRVFRRIRVAVLSTGNEVVEIASPIRPGQVYDSNRAGLKAALRAMGCEVMDFGIVGDHLATIETALERASHTADAIISTGGVSVGDYDLVRLALENKGNVNFWKVAMKPGKPQAYGRLGRAAFFGLPGNPVSGLTVFYLLIRPALFRLMGGGTWPKKMFQATFKGHFSKKHSRKEFLRAIVRFTVDGVNVETTGPQGSGILTSLSAANALIVIPEGPVTITSADRVTVWMIDDD
ncbi:MAG: molybdopterin molybdotransferase MoeA [Magnetococcales bacterium]|nr:molybdopterin molybdotransferase MoeA [Magnetococcales bacterium]HIJ83277.1 molybdopterin molybdotransferase MoeA [Magnetococcales bacterium]